MAVRSIALEAFSVTGDFGFKFERISFKFPKVPFSFQMGRWKSKRGRLSFSASFSVPEMFMDLLELFWSSNIFRDSATDFSRFGMSCEKSALWSMYRIISFRSDAWVRFFPELKSEMRFSKTCPGFSSDIVRLKSLKLF